MFAMGVSGTDHAEFQRALRAGNWHSAFAAAHSLPVVRLEDALELVLLGASQVEKDRYERLAQRWLTRLLQERRLSLREIAWAVERLADMREGITDEAGGAPRKYIAAGRSPS
jgi:hypothetical protein